MEELTDLEISNMLDIALKEVAPAYIIKKVLNAFHTTLYNYETKGILENALKKSVIDYCKKHNITDAAGFKQQMVKDITPKVKKKDISLDFLETEVILNKYCWELWKGEDVPNIDDIITEYYKNTTEEDLAMLGVPQSHRVPFYVLYFTRIKHGKVKKLKEVNNAENH